MDPTPHSVEGAIALFFSIVAAVVGGIARVAHVLRKRDDRRMQSVPPTALPPTRLPDISQRLDTLERTVTMQAKWREEELVGRISELEKNLADVTGDLGRMQLALAQERAGRLRSEGRLAVELEQRRMLENRLAEAGHARDKAERERDAAVRAAQALRGRH